MNRKIILSADNMCDIGDELREGYDVKYINSRILVGEKTYVDMEEISPEEIYDAWYKHKILPKTTGIIPSEYYRSFKKWIADGYDIIHINIGSAISSSYQNCSQVAKEIGHIYPIDSASLSTGIGHLVIKAYELMEKGLSPKEVQNEIIAMREKVHASFILDTLEFMKAGGRCSPIVAFGANILSLKPCIEVNNKKCGEMGVGKKYRGSMEIVLNKYVHDKLFNVSNLDLDRVFITHSGSPKSDIALVKKEIQKLCTFKNIYVTRASGTISSHCGPRTLGVLFMTRL
ncbi:MAG: DegV family protein [Oscillospiraceae bacterium]|nr:DegV family protein [Oscillospiraceae bacterium]